MAKKLTEVIDPAEIREVMGKQVLRGQLEDLANRRITDPAERTAFVEGEIPLTDDEKQIANDVALLLTLDPTR